MRALKRLILFSLAALAVVALAPVAAAVGVDAAAVPQGSTAQTLPSLVALFGVAGLGLTGLGIVVQLSAKDKDGNKERFRLDTDSEQFAENLEDYVEAKQEETARPLRERNEALSAEAKALRDMVIGEVVRVAALSHAASGAEGAFDAEGETAFLETLTPEKLKLHYERATASNVTVEQKTSGDAPTSAQLSGDEIPFGTVATA